MPPLNDDGAPVRYATIERTIWRQHLLGVGPDARLTYMALRSNPYGTVLGCLVEVSVALLAEFTGLTAKRVQSALGELERAGLVRLALAHSLVMDVLAVPKPGSQTSDKTIRGWWRCWRQMPSCALRMEVVEVLRLSCAPTAPAQLAWRETFGRLSVTGGAGRPDAPPDGAPDAPCDAPSHAPSDGASHPPSDAPCDAPPDGAPDAPLPARGPARAPALTRTTANSEPRTAVTHTHAGEQAREADRPATTASDLGGFCLLWRDTYHVDADQTDEAFDRAWSKVKGTAGARRVEPAELAPKLLVAFREWGETLTNGAVWSPSPALFSSRFLEVVARLDGARSKAKTPEAAAARRTGVTPLPVSTPGSHRVVDEDPEVKQRARAIAAAAEARQREPALTPTPRRFLGASQPPLPAPKDPDETGGRMPVMAVHHG